MDPSCTFVNIEADIFDNPDYSDVTLCLVAANRREVFCHKVILCNNSEYFRTLCGVNSSVGDREKTSFDLTDDNADAAHLMIKFIYIGELGLEGWEWQNEWEFQLDMVKMGAKYLLPRLEKAAADQFHIGIKKIETLRELVEMIKASHGQVNQYTMNGINDVMRAHLHHLMRHEGFRQMLQELDPNDSLIQTVLYTFVAPPTDLRHYWVNHLIGPQDLAAELTKALNYYSHGLMLPDKFIVNNPAEVTGQRIQRPLKTMPTFLPKP